MVKKQQMQWSNRGGHLLPSIENRVDVRTDTAAAQDGVTPQLI
jgi:hypothetical protein